MVIFLLLCLIALAPILFVCGIVWAMGIVLFLAKVGIIIFFAVVAAKILAGLFK